MGPAARLPRGRAAAGSWQWARTAETQRALLDAARAVFAEQGFADASIADVVERAGSSVGSLYHHFGGKSELFIAPVAGLPAGPGGGCAQRRWPGPGRPG